MLIRVHFIDEVRLGGPTHDAETIKPGGEQIPAVLTQRQQQQICRKNAEQVIQTTPRILWK